jgi:PAS domain S-box-containing protein
VEWGRTIAGICGGAVALLGLLVVLGWHAHSRVLVQVSPQFVPMAYNTAWGFLFGGVALLASVFGRLRAGRFCAVFPTLIGLLTLFQYATGQRLYLDFLFAQPFFISGGQSITAIAPNSGLGFLLSGFALLLLTRAGERRFSLANAVLGCLVLVIGATALIGYLVGIPAAYGWRNFLQMAPHTAVGLLLLGVGMVVQAGNQKRAGAESTRHWAPLLSGITVLIAAIVMGLALRSEENQQVIRITKSAAHGIRDEITTHLNVNLRSLAFLARLWGAHKTPSQAEWEADANYFVSHNSSLQAVEWVDPALRVRWVAPVRGNEAALNMKSAVDDRRREALETARQQRQIALTGTINLVQGGKGFLAYAPIFRGDTFEGFIVGVFRTQQCFEQVLGNLVKDFSVQIYDGKTLVCQINATDQTQIEVWGQTSVVNCQGRTWQVRVTPSQELVKEIKSSIPEVLLGGGLMVAILLGGLVHLLQTTFQQSRDLGRVNQTLNQDIAERQRMEILLRASEAGLKLSQRIGKMGGWELDLATQTLTWADETYRLFGRCPADFTPSRPSFMAAVHPEDRTKVRATVEEAVREGHTFQVEHRILLPDGTERVMLEQAEVITDPATGGVKLAGVVQDITERKQAELEIEHQAAFARFNPNPVLELSAAGEINYFNGATEKMALTLGLEGPRQMLPPTTAAIVGECLASGKPILRVETQIGGRVISWSFFPVQLNQRVHCYAGDITVRKQMEAERDQLIQDLQSSLANVKSLSGLLPICAGCKQIRDDKGYWSQVESYIQNHSEAKFTHGLCPDCIKKYYPDLDAP